MLHFANAALRWVREPICREFTVKSVLCGKVIRSHTTGRGTWAEPNLKYERQALKAHQGVFHRAGQIVAQTERANRQGQGSRPGHH